MIGHHTIDVYAHLGKVCRNVFPTLYNDLPKTIQTHFSGVYASP